MPQPAANTGSHPLPDDKPVIDGRAFRQAMGKFATGVTILTYAGDNETHGMTANAFMSLSVDPPMVLIAARNRARFATLVGCGDRFGISVLKEEQESLSNHFGGRPDPNVTVEFEHLQAVPVLPRSLVQIAARVDAIHPGGDHLIYTAKVEQIQQTDTGEPLLFYSSGYRKLHMADLMQP